MSPLTLSRDEAAAISLALWSTHSTELGEDIRCLELDPQTAEGAARTIAELEKVIERVRIEAAVRETAGWWGADAPWFRDIGARAYEDDALCPDQFVLSDEAACALRTFCESHLAEAVAWLVRAIRDRGPDDMDVGLTKEQERTALIGLAARLGTELPHAVS